MYMIMIIMTMVVKKYKLRRSSKSSREDYYYYYYFGDRVSSLNPFVMMKDLKNSCCQWMDKCMIACQSRRVMIRGMNKVENRVSKSSFYLSSCRRICYHLKREKQKSAIVWNFVFLDCLYNQNNNSSSSSIGSRGAR